MIDALVIGAGLASAGVAHALARRGAKVTVLDAAAAVAAGASSLPAGLLAPHVSPDDAVLSQITRAGVATTLDFARRHLVAGRDWAPTGVLERRLDGRATLPAEVTQASVPADPAQRAALGLAAADVATWHASGGWLQPAALVRALMAHTNIGFVGGVDIARLVREGDRWQALDATGQTQGAAPLLVVCGGWASGTLLQGDGRPWPLQAIRGQLSIGSCTPASDAAAPWPVNGKGSWLPRVPLAGDDAWLAGAGFERDRTGPPDAAEVAAAHADNIERLRLLLPAAAEEAARALSAGALRSWFGVRGTLPDRLPAVGPIDAERLPGLWTSSGMGARGISLAVLCGELLAARWAGEDLPLAPRLARALAAERVARWRKTADDQKYGHIGI